MKLAILSLSLLFILKLNSQVQMTKTAKIEFFSKTPLEDIEAKSGQAIGAINLTNGKIIFKVKMTSFKFAKKLMQEHFNENYIESSKFPYAEFSGLIRDIPPLTVDKDYNTTIKGSFKLHGVVIEREIPIKLSVKKGKIDGKANFLVKCSDHDIQVPNIVRKNISENIEIQILASFEPVIEPKIQP